MSSGGSGSPPGVSGPSPCDAPALEAERRGGGSRGPGSVGALETLARWLATGLGTGYLWPAPGTWGSLLALVVFVALLAPAGPVVQVAACLVVTAVGTWAAQVTAARLEEDDPSKVVVDEVAGMWIALVGVGTTPAWIGWGLAFLVFRLMDIVKPFPARRLEDLPGGLGIMADDVVAGLYAQALVRLALAWWGP